MRSWRKTLWTVALSSLIAVGCQKGTGTMSRAGDPPEAPNAVATDGKLSVSGPYDSGNLTVWLVEGPDTSAGRTYTTLSEALEQKKVIVHETGNVNTLAIENVSDDVVFVPAGSIVKGGRQDRTLGTDLIITKADGKMPIDAFCVEHGRWSNRGQEASSYFGGNSAMVSGKSLKLAANSNSGASDQGTVWSGVSDIQASLRVAADQKSLGGDSVTATESASSYQLSMETKAVKKMTEDRRAAIAAAAKGKKNVVGYVYAVDHKIAGGNVYASPSLFEKLWPMLLDAAVVESLTESAKAPVAERGGVAQSGTAAPATQPALPSNRAVLDAISVHGKITRKRDLNGQTTVNAYDDKDSIYLETIDKQTGQPAARSVLVKPDDNPMRNPQRGPNGQNGENGQNGQNGQNSASNRINAPASPQPAPNAEPQR
jgi:hypothetical protein